MKFFVEILSGSSFEIEVDRKDTLLEVKQKIERSQRIPVSKQTLIVDGIVILREDLNVKQCQIVQDSCLQLEVSTDDNPNHNDEQMPQTEQSPAPWISVEEYFERQDWPLTAEEIKKIYSYRPESTQGLSKVQDSPVMFGSSNKNQVSHQTEQPPPSKLVKGIIGRNMNVSEMMKVGSKEKNTNDQVPQTKQSPPSNSVKGIHKIQDLPVMFGSINKNQVSHQTEQSPPSNSVKGIIGRNKNMSKMMKVGSKKNNNSDQMPQTKQSPPSNSVKGIPKIQDSPVKKRMVVLVKSPCSGEGKASKIILVSVNAMDEVTKLRDELVQSQQRGEINLPQDGYFLTDGQKVLNEDQSYEWNGIENMDTIVLVPRLVENSVKGIVGRNKNVPKMMKVGSKKKKNNDQVPQMKQSPLSNSVKGITKIQDSPVKKRMVVNVVTPSGEGKAEMSILVSVKAMDKVQKLRDELVQSQQRGQINLPQDGYFLSHRKKLLIEDQSYKWNGVQDGDSIVLIPRLVPRNFESHNSLDSKEAL